MLRVRHKRGNADQALQLILWCEHKCETLNVSLVVAGGLDAHVEALDRHCAELLASEERDEWVQPPSWLRL